MFVSRAHAHEETAQSPRMFITYSKKPKRNMMARRFVVTLFRFIDAPIFNTRFVLNSELRPSFVAYPSYQRVKAGSLWTSR